VPLTAEHLREAGEPEAETASKVDFTQGWLREVMANRPEDPPSPPHVAVPETPPGVPQESPEGKRRRDRRPDDGRRHSLRSVPSHE
jgi:hypothetical protein